VSENPIRDRTASAVAALIIITVAVIVCGTVVTLWARWLF